MTSLTQRRCLHHAEREAVARCPECERFFCRECVSEHDDRVLCASCLNRQLVVAPRKQARWSVLVRLAQITLGLLIAWFFFYEVGTALLDIPSSFHENMFGVGEAQAGEE